MNRQSASLLRWAGILIIFANVMAWEGQPAARTAVDATAWHAAHLMAVLQLQHMQWWQKKSGFHAAMYLAKRWRAPEAATQPRNLLENYSGDRQSWSAQTFSNGSKHQQTKRPSTVAAFCLESPSLRTNSPWSLVLCRYGVPRAEGHPHEVPALRLPPPGQGKTTHMAAQSRRHRDHCSLQHCGARRLAIDVNAKC